MTAPVLTPGGISNEFGTYNGYVSNQFVGWPPGDYVLAHSRLSGPFAIFHGLTGAAVMLDTIFDPIGPCMGAAQDTIVCAHSLCSCGVPYWVFIGPLITVGGAATCPQTDFSPPNIQAGGGIGVGGEYDFEALGFSVAPDNLIGYVSMMCSGGAGPGPLTLGAATFPSGTYRNGVGPTISNVFDYPLTLMHFQSLDGLSDLYVAVVATGAGAGNIPDAGSDWTHVMGGTTETNVTHVYIYSPAPISGPRSGCVGGCGEDAPYGPCGLVDDVITDICKRAGLSNCQIDTSLLTDANIMPSNAVQGFVIERPTPAADILKTLMLAYFFDGCETAGTM